MKLTPQPDGRIAIVFSADEDQVLNDMGHDASVDSRFFAAVVYERLMQPNAPDLVKLIASMGMPPGK